MRAWFNIRAFERLGRWQGVPIALALLAALMVIRAVDPAPLETLRLHLFDQMQEIKPRAWEQRTPITIVDIDEESLRRYGQWPWPRTYLAALVSKIRRAGAPAIGFDVLFPEDDRLSPSRMLENFAFTFADEDRKALIGDDLHAAISALPSNDTHLAETVRDAGVVVLGMAALKKQKGGVDLPPFARTSYRTMGEIDDGALHQFHEVIHTIEEIGSAARGHGVTTTVPERDGVVRRPPLAVRIGDQIYPSLSIEMLRVAFGKQWFVVAGDGGDIAGIGLPGASMTRTASDGRIWLHFAEHQPERYVSAADVLDGEAPAALFNGHLVLISSTGLGLTDFVATPVEARMPGVEVHAQVLESILYGLGLHRPDYTMWIEIGLLLLAGVVIIGLVPPIRPIWSPLPYAGLFALLLVTSWVAYDHFKVLIDSSFVVIGTGILYSVMLATTRAAIERARRLLETQLEAEREAAARLDGELSAARNIQMGILPREFPAFPERDEFTIYAMIEPARAVGGDLYDFALVDDDHLFFMVGDVSGKGVPASLFMAITKALYKSNALRHGDAIDHIMSRANAEISRENPAMLFVTMAAGLLNLRTGELDICNAGHDAPLRLRPGQPPEALESEGGPPLCVLDDFEYPSDRFVLAPGDSVAIVTDGVTEAMNEAEELYGMERTIAVLRDASGAGKPEDIANALYADIQSFAGAAERYDDTTIMVVRYNGASAAAEERA